MDFLITALFVFMLAAFLGLDIIRRVSRLLHTPLMALTNAISSIAVVGAIIIAGEAHDTLSAWLGAAAVFLPRRQTFYGSVEVGVVEPGGHHVTLAQFDRG